MTTITGGQMVVISKATLGCRLIEPGPLSGPAPRKRRRRRRERECPDIAAFMRRQLRAMVRRAAEGDLEAMSALKQIDQETAVALGDAARALNDPAGPNYSWREIAREYGTTHQNAIKRWATKKETV
jgi:hypothetical protein